MCSHDFSWRTHSGLINFQLCFKTEKKLENCLELIQSAFPVVICQYPMRSKQENRTTDSFSAFFSPVMSARFWKELRVKQTQKIEWAMTWAIQLYQFDREIAVCRKLWNLEVKEPVPTRSVSRLALVLLPFLNWLTQTLSGKRAGFETSSLILGWTFPK